VTFFLLFIDFTSTIVTFPPPPENSDDFFLVIVVFSWPFFAHYLLHICTHAPLPTHAALELISAYIHVPERCSRKIRDGRALLWCAPHYFDYWWWTVLGDLLQCLLLSSRLWKRTSIMQKQQNKQKFTCEASIELSTACDDLRLPWHSATAHPISRCYKKPGY